MRSVHDFLHNATHSLVSGIIVHNEKDAEGMMGLARLMELFDAIDEDFIHCWNRRCDLRNGYCQRFTEEKALSMYDSLEKVSQAERYTGYDWFERAKVDGNDNNALLAMGLRETQAADVFITQKWVQNRVWLLCLNHGLLRTQSDRVELTFGFAVTIAESTIQLCRSLRLSSMEAHGIGFVCAPLTLPLPSFHFHSPMAAFSTLTPSPDRETIRHRRRRNRYPLQHKPTLRHGDNSARQLLRIPTYNIHAPDHGGRLFVTAEQFPGW